VDAARAKWAHALFRRSVLKQEKFGRIVEMLGPVEGKTCLDVGGDNGVISYLLRQRGGTWHSADLDPATVESIRELVGPDVHLIDGGRTPFPDRFFDVVVIVDFLEHIHTDRQFADELGRILRPGGHLIVNVPHLKPRSLLNRLRHAIGLTDEKHGHVRPGYTLAGLRELLDDRFVVQASRTYSRAFSELIDVALNAAYELRRRPRPAPARSAKGTVVTRADLDSRQGQFRALALLYPGLWLVSRLDRLLVLQPGYKLIVKCVRRA
jgi:SAM-dependent methyltransferase